MKIVKPILGVLCFLVLLGCVSTTFSDEDSENLQKGTQEAKTTEVTVESTVVDEEPQSEKERLVKDVEWDLAIDHSTKRAKTYYLIDFNESIAIKYFKKADKISGVEFGTVTGNLDDILNITFLENDGKEWHQYFSWAYPDKPGSNLIYHLDSAGEAYDYEIWSTASESIVAGYIKDYVIPEKIDVIDVPVGEE